MHHIGPETAQDLIRSLSARLQHDRGKNFISTVSGTPDRAPLRTMTFGVRRLSEWPSLSKPGGVVDTSARLR